MADNVTLNVIRLQHSKDLDLMKYATDGASGMDLVAAIEDNIVLRPMQRKLIPTGMKWEIPENYEIQIRPRSGLAYKHGITCLNTPGTIDSDYRGEVFVLLVNLGEEDFVIERGMRIAQAVIAPVSKAIIKEKIEISETNRGEGGFGSTGY